MQSAMASTQTTTTFLFLSVSLFLLPLCCHSACFPGDRSALLQINQQMNNAFGLANADPNSDCCNWWQLVGCRDGRVNNIFMANGPEPLRAYSGQIPEAIAQLTELQSITIINLPNMNGPLPAAFANLKKLVNLDIRGTSVSGPIPDWIGGFSSLNALTLIGNQFSGQIPASLANLANIENFTISGHPLVTGPIPDSLGRFVGKFPINLWLSNNSLSSSIPKSFENARFRNVELQNNQLVGDLSALFKNPSGSLESIDVSSNRLEFDLSGVVFPPSLTTIKLSHNNIYGSIPEAIVNQTGLSVFDVSYNSLCGRIPQGGAVANIPESSYVHNKCLCGPPLPNNC